MTNEDKHSEILKEEDMDEFSAELGTEVHPAEFIALEARDPTSTASIDLLLDVVLNVNVELGRSSMPIKDILALGPGSVVELDKLAGEPVDVFINGTMIARGEVVVVDEKFGVRVAEIVTPAKRIASLAQ